MVNRLPELESMRRLRAEGGRDPEKGRIVLQYEDSEGGRHELGMSLSDAMILMRELESTRRELDVPLPRMTH